MHKTEAGFGFGTFRDPPCPRNVCCGSEQPEGLDLGRAGARMQQAALGVSWDFWSGAGALGCLLGPGREPRPSRCAHVL
jgi:hypothetical protein